MSVLAANIDLFVFGHHAAASLARFKLPRRIAFGAGGRTKIGKVQMARLRDAYRF